MNILGQFGIARQESRKYWDKLGIFVNSWNTSSIQERGTQNLLRILFESFVGNSVSDGSVRIKGNHSVTCVTADAVFADASKNWLVQMRDEAKNGKSLVVWAVSRLLPTEFAFPGMWFLTQGDVVGDENSRVEHLESFISAVIGACNSHGSDIEYRRVTVLEQLRLDRVDADKLTNLFSNSLDNWLLWDPRVLRQGFPSREDAADQTYEFMTAVRYLRGEKAPLDRYPAFTRERLNSAWGQDDAEMMRIMRMLPLLAPCEVKLFGTKFGDCPENAGCTNHLDGLVLGCDNSILGHPIDRGNIERILQLMPVGETRKRTSELLNRLTVGGFETTLSFLNALGWRSLRQWYCIGLHTKTHNQSEAFWVLRNGQASRTLPGFGNSAFDNGFFSDLHLDWNGVPLLTLDILLIGLRDQGGDAENVRWSGAVVSNLSLARTECTVQLKTDPLQLQNIAKVIGTLCAAPTDYGGRWENEITFSSKPTVPPAA